MSNSVYKFWTFQFQHIANRQWEVFRYFCGFLSHNNTQLPQLTKKCLLLVNFKIFEADKPPSGTCNQMFRRTHKPCFWSIITKSWRSALFHYSFFSQISLPVHNCKCLLACTSIFRPEHFEGSTMADSDGCQHLGSLGCSYHAYSIAQLS